MTWISVKDEYPLTKYLHEDNSETRDVLILTSRYDMYVARYCHRKYPDGRVRKSWWSESIEFMPEYVTHWMDLPTFPTDKE